MGNIARRQRQDQGPWTLRGQGLGLWPKVVNGPGFEDEEEIEVVRADRGAVSLLRRVNATMDEKMPHEPPTWLLDIGIEIEDWLRDHDTGGQ